MHGTLTMMVQSTALCRVPHIHMQLTGIYTVNLTVTGPGGSDVELKTNYITAAIFVPPPVAAFSGTPVVRKFPIECAVH